MAEARLAHEADLDGFRKAARRFLHAGLPPAEVLFAAGDEASDLFAGATAAAAEEEAPPLMVPPRFASMAEAVVCHCDGERFALLYRLLWRLQQGERHLLELASDPEVARASAMAKAVRREEHKMHAFVRFREVAAEDGPAWLAWFEPVHHVVDLAAPFFVRRFASMRWSILTPRRSAHWDGTLRFGPGARRSDAPAADALEEHWRTYYASIFNPARLKPAAMRREMPKRYWANMPETALVRPLMREAARRTGAMVASGPSPESRRGRVALAPHADHAPAPLPAGAQPLPASLAELREAAGRCRACPLWRDATQTVSGEGPKDAALMIVGEQPGDQEDIEGRPFVGPAGRLLDRALVEAGIERGETYLTNAVKHFKFTPRGKRRIHQKPDAGEIEHCRWWLEQERRLVRPRLVLAMGASAGRALLRRPVTIARERGRFQKLEDGSRLLLTTHPSYILRLPDPPRQNEAYAAMLADLRLAAGHLRETGEAAGAGS